METLIRQVLAEGARLAALTEAIDYEPFVALIDLRQQLADQLALRPNLNEVEKELLSQIGRYDEAILRHMAVLKEEAAQGLRKMSASRVQRGAYEYREAVDGIMFDKGV